MEDASLQLVYSLNACNPCLWKRIDCSRAPVAYEYSHYARGQLAWDQTTPKTQRIPLTGSKISSVCLQQMFLINLKGALMKFKWHHKGEKLHMVNVAQSNWIMTIRNSQQSCWIFQWTCLFFLKSPVGYLRMQQPYLSFLFLKPSSSARTEGGEIPVF